MLARPPQPRNPLVPVLIAVVVLAIVGAVIFFATSSSEPAAEAARSASGDEAPKPEDQRAALSLELDSIGQLIETNALAKAESALDTLLAGPLGKAVTAPENKDLRDRANDYRADIALGQLVNKADILEKSGDAKGALDVYVEILAQDAQHAHALERVEALRAELQPKTGTLKLTTSPPDATLEIGGQVLSGTTHELPPGTHDVTLSAKGYASQTTPVTITAGEIHNVSLELKKKGKKGSGKKKPGDVPTVGTGSDSGRTDDGLLLVPKKKKKKSKLKTNKDGLLLP